MKNISKLALFSAATLFTGASYAADINLTPADCDTGVGGNCWTSNETSNPSAEDIQGWIGTPNPLTVVYKQDFGNSTTGATADEEGAFAASYSTTFSADNDPSGATISYGSGPTIICPECYLLVKDGNSTPVSYVFDLGSWDGTGSITLTEFWPGDGGAISNVQILASEVPLPAAVWMFGSALLGFAGISRRKAKTQTS